MGKKRNNRTDSNIPAKRDDNAGVGQNTGRLQIQEIFTGPIPHPDIMQKYEMVLPGLADRIFKYAEVEQSHRHEVQNEQLSISKREITISFWMHVVTNICITTIFLAFLVAGAYALHLGNVKTALAIFAIPVSRIIIAMLFTLSRESKRRKT